MWILMVEPILEEQEPKETCFFCLKRLEKCQLSTFTLPLHNEKKSSNRSDIENMHCEDCASEQKIYQEKTYHALLVELKQVMGRTELQSELNFSQGTLSKYLNNKLPEFLAIDVAIRIHKLHLEKYHMSDKGCVVCNQKDSLKTLDLNNYNAASGNTKIEYKVAVCSKHLEPMIFAASLDYSSLLNYLIQNAKSKNQDKNKLFESLNTSRATYYRILKEKPVSTPHNKPIPLAVYKLVAKKLYEDNENYIKARDKFTAWLFDKVGCQKHQLQDNHHIEEKGEFYECDFAIFDKYHRLKVISVFSMSCDPLQTKKEKEYITLMEVFKVDYLFILNSDICAYKSTKNQHEELVLVEIEEKDELIPILNATENQGKKSEIKPANSPYKSSANNYVQPTF
jgi:hypothetical protein